MTDYYHPNNLARNIRLHTDRAGLTITELAHNAGISRQYIYLILSGGATIGIDKLCQLAAALGVTPDDLLSSDPGPDLDPLEGRVVYAIRRGEYAGAARMILERWDKLG